MMDIINKINGHVVLPGLASAHSHAFQRALRGRTQRPATQAATFWSWRGLMYHLAERLDPDTIYALSRLAYTELAMSGVTAVGEFHYVHHDPQGRPYADRLALAEAVIQAAKDAGIRLTLIRTAYLRAGFDQELTPAQRRFVDPDLDPVLGDITELQKRFAAEPLVEIAAAAHSIRAVPLPKVVALAEFARRKQIPFHMHIAEQRRELEECQAEYGTTPVRLLHDAGVLAPEFVGVHGTHLSQEEITQIGRAGAMVCLCRTTERDLGDGLPQTADLLAAGVSLCVGVDSHCAADAFEEIRAVELDDRSRTERRIVAATAPELLAIGSREGYRAIGQPQGWEEDQIMLRLNDPALLGAAEPLLADHVVFGATPRAVDRVIVAGRQIVDGGVHMSLDEARSLYLKALARVY